MLYTLLIELDPKNAAYAKTMTAIQKPNAEASSFQGAFEFGVSSEDFKE